MKAILIDRKGFRKEMSINKESPYLEYMVVPSIDWSKTHDVEEVLRVEKSLFYFERSFLDEFEIETFIYKER